MTGVTWHDWVSFIWFTGTLFLAGMWLGGWMLNRMQQREKPPQCDLCRRPMVRVWLCRHRDQP